MKLKILDIKKRNWFCCLFTIEEYRVSVKLKKDIFNLDCWGGVKNPSAGSLWYSLERKLNITAKNPVEAFNLIASLEKPQTLIGQNIEVVEKWKN